MKLDPIRIVNEKELTEYVKLDVSLIEEIEKGFLALSNNMATVPPIMMLPVPALDGEVDIKSAFVHSLPSLAVKIAALIESTGIFDMLFATPLAAFSEFFDSELIKVSLVSKCLFISLPI